LISIFRELVQFYSDALISDSAIQGNLVEGVSDIVNGIFSNEDDKFDINFNYNPADRTNLENQISDEFGVSVSTQISSRILINGKVGIPVGGVTESVVVEFIGEANGYTQGVGLSYSYDFNTFKELLRKIFIKQRVKEK